ncbi:Synaptic vesicle glycoprotein 2C [Apodemus speciosus]|uniref:Synaptic vesicle glycoprotein 2C n=1 Tax=Apodemus speciosus TaxID=105296 RepID=A0ABQ0FGU3_APOSI
MKGAKDIAKEVKKQTVKKVNQAVDRAQDEYTQRSYSRFQDEDDDDDYYPPGETYSGEANDDEGSSEATEGHDEEDEIYEGEYQGIPGANQGKDSIVSVGQPKGDEYKDRRELESERRADEEELAQQYELIIQECGHGRFQWALFFVLGMALMADGVEVFVVGFVLPSAETDLCIPNSGSGWLGSIVYLGMMVGAFFWGGLADKVGRKQSLLICMSVNGFFAFLSSFVQGYGFFLICRLLSGFGSNPLHCQDISSSVHMNQLQQLDPLANTIHKSATAASSRRNRKALPIGPNLRMWQEATKWIGGAIPTVFSYFAEVLAREKRGEHLSWLCMFWMIGGIYASAMAWAIIPHYAFLGVKFKSVTFKDSVFKSCTFDDVTSVNTYFKNCTFIDTIFENTDFEPYKFIDSEFQNCSFLHNKTGCQITFDDDYSAYWIYFVNFLGTLAVLPGNIVSALLMDRIGRLTMLGGSMVLSGISCFFLWFGTSESMMIGMLCLYNGLTISAWNSLDVVTVELYPTDRRRATGFGFLNALCKAAAVLGNLIFGSLVSITKAIPILLASTVLVCGGLVGLRLPDTRTQVLM